MDRRERAPDPEEAWRLALASLQARIWTALPGIVDTVGNNGQTVDVQPTILGGQRETDGTYTPVTMPILPNCVVVWQGGGGVTGTFPIKKGDECVVVFASRCIDGWWKEGGVQDQLEPRMHNLTDGFAIVGLRSLPRNFVVDTNSAQIRSDDGSTVIGLNPTTQVVTISAPGGINLNGVTIDSSGNLHSPATITGATDVIADTKSGKTHTHNEIGRAHV